MGMGKMFPKSLVLLFPLVHATWNCGVDPDTADLEQQANLTVRDVKVTALMTAAKALHANRNDVVYTQGDKRWNGIDNKKMPPACPKYSDCSSAVSWMYWTVFGPQGSYPWSKDKLNGQDWKAGYTGTMTNYGKSVSKSAMKRGDLVFYGGTKSVPGHVAMYVGHDKVVSHGSDPAGCYSVDYRSDRIDIRCYFDCDSDEAEEALV